MGDPTYALEGPRCRMTTKIISKTNLLDLADLDSDPFEVMSQLNPLFDTSLRETEGRSLYAF
jgi:hypothetical protein